MRPSLLSSVCFLSLASAALVYAHDWPQWRGPNRDDLSREIGLLKAWPAEGPPHVWTSREAGIGYSSLAIADGRIFTMGSEGDVTYLIALSESDGGALWQTRIGERLDDGRGDGPRGTPSVDGARVYALSGRGDLICARVTDGKELWRASMTELGGRVPGWGYSESVLIDGDRVVCTPGGRQGAVVAFNKANGAILWRTKDFTDAPHYTSIVAASIQGQAQYVKFTEDSVVGIAPATGEVLWRTDWNGRTAVIPTPIVQGNDVYVSCGYGVGCAQFRIGPGNEVEEVFRNRVMKNHHGGVLLYKGHVYGYSDSIGWVCQDFKTGEEIWSEERKLGKGAVTFADGMLYCLDEDQGTVVLAEATSDGWNERGRFTLSPQSEQRSRRGKVWTHPVVANGKLYLRDQEIIACYDVKAGSAGSTSSSGGE